MPPYNRETAASSASAASSVARFGKKPASTVEAAPDVDEWPERYEGNGGVGMYESQLPSTRRRIAVTGRSVQYANFASQQAMNASACAVFRVANNRAARSVDKLASPTRSSAIAFQCPAGVTVPAPSAQKSA